MAAAHPCVFNPPKLIFGDAAMAHVVKVKLNKAPTKKVGVFFTSDSLRFDHCMLVFTPTDWDKEKQITVSPSPFLTPFLDGKFSRDLFIDAITSSRDKDFHYKTVKYSLTRSGEAGGVCVGSGDPHYRNFGGRGFDFMGQGTFYYVNSKYLTVMVQTRCPSFNRGVTIATAIAVRYGKSRWIFGCNSGESVASEKLEGMTVERGAGGKNFRLVMNDGAIVQFTKNYWTQGEFYLDITITLPLHYKDRVNGICGNIGKSDWIMNGPDYKGTVTGDVYKMGNSYAVPADDDLFKCARRKPTGQWLTCKGDIDTSAGGGVKGKFARCTRPHIPPVPDQAKEEPAYPVNNNDDGYVIDDNAKPKAYDGKDDIPFAPITAEALEAVEPMCEVQAEELCAPALLHPVANKYVNPEVFVRNCVFDACAIRPNYVESWKQTYHATLYELAKSLFSEPSSMRKVRLEMGNLILAFGLHGRQPQIFVEGGSVQLKCENGGKLCPIGCVCPEPFTGRLCKQRYDKFQKKRR